MEGKTRPLALSSTSQETLETKTDSKSCYNLKPFTPGGSVRVTNGAY